MGVLGRRVQGSWFGFSNSLAFPCLADSRGFALVASTLLPEVLFAAADGGFDDFQPDACWSMIMRQRESPLGTSRFQV